MPEALTYDFMQHALLAGLLASIACGIIGSLVVVNRMVLLAGGIAHTAYGGVGLAFYLGWPVLPCTVGFTSAAALVIAGITLHNSGKVDTIVGVFWAAGMAVGIILLDLAPGYNVDLMSFLFGSILAVPVSDLWLMAGLDVLICAVVLLCYRDMLAMSFDPEFARTRGVPVGVLYVVMLVLVAVSVVMIIRVVGLILVIALLTIPPLLAERGAASLGLMMRSATGWSVAFCLAGLWVSYRFNISAGAAIIACAATCYFCVLAGGAGLRRLRARGGPLSPRS